MGRALVALVTAVWLAAGPAAADAVDLPEPLRSARQAWLEHAHVKAASLADEAARKLQGPPRGAAWLIRGAALSAAGRWGEAVTAWDKAAAVTPHLEDRIRFARGEAFRKLERYDDALNEFSKAQGAAKIDVVAMQAESWRTRTRLKAGAPGMLRRSNQFFRRYATYPERHLLSYEMARAEEEIGRTRSAAKQYRKLWLEYPDRLAGSRAGERLEVLQAQDRRIPSISLTDRLERVRRLVAAREFEWAEEEIAGLLHRTKGSLRLQVLEQLAIVAHRRGDHQRAHKMLLELKKQGGEVRHWLERNALVTGDTAPAKSRILRGRRATRRTATGRLITLANVYLDSAQYEEARDTLALVRRKRAPGYMARWMPWIDYQLGRYDEAAPKLLSRRREQRWSRGRRTYWQARAYHRGGNPCPARQGYEKVIADTPHGYYALWARKRLTELALEVTRNHEAGRPLPRCPSGDGDGDGSKATPWTPPDPLAGWSLPRRRENGPNPDEVSRAFASLVASHGSVLPWLERARDLWLAGNNIAAGEELRQAYWVSRGAVAPKVGLPRLWGGRARLGPKLVPRGRKARVRARLSQEQMEHFVTAVRAAGETGFAMRLRRPPWNDVERWHPLAYEDLVRGAAGRYDIPPELLWSIMRIESYFNRHALSHANAMGLMQILPRTGRRIARRKGETDFEVGKLYVPTTGMDFAGWYLRALSDRFHGQYPLVIASYNGGPHNVASWITKRADGDAPLPMDEFLEEIPFTETYRYVRRVLASMAAYHALAGLPPPDLPDYVNRDVSRGVNF